MSSFCTAKATHIFFSKKFQHICVSLDVNFNESLTNDVISFEQLGPDNRLMNDKFHKKMIIITDLLIIDHLISVFVTLTYLPLVFRYLNSLPYLI